MDIEYTQTPEGYVKYETLTVGDKFRCEDDGDYYIVIDAEDADGDYQSVNLGLEEGLVAAFDKGTLVYPVEAKLVVDGPEPE